MRENLRNLVRPRSPSLAEGYVYRNPQVLRVGLPIQTSGGELMFGTIDEAMKAYGVSKATIERKISSGDLPSYKNSEGRRVWIKPFDSLKVQLEMLADEIAHLRAEPQAVREKPQAVREKPQAVREKPQAVREDEHPLLFPADFTAPRVSVVRGTPDFDNILGLIRDRWEGSLNDLDRELGFCQGWSSRLFSKKRDRKGRLSKRSRRCWPNWLKIQALLEGKVLEEAA